MSNKKSTTEKAAAGLALSGEMTIQRIADVKRQLTDKLAEGDGLTLDLKAVSRADLTFLQLLCSAHRTAQVSGKTLNCRNIPESVDQAITEAGFIRDNMGCGQECSDSCLWFEE